MTEEEIRDLQRVRREVAHRMKRCPLRVSSPEWQKQCGCESCTTDRTEIDRIDVVLIGGEQP